MSLEKDRQMNATRIAGLLIALAACSSTTTADNGGNTSDGGTSTSPSGNDAGPIVVPAACDLAADPKDSPACVSDDVALFVDGRAGNDASAGTRDLPFKTITAALGKLGNRPRIYICGDTVLDEAVKLDGDAAASLYGGYSCVDWNYVGTPATVAPSAPGFALRISTSRSGLVVSDLAFRAKDGVAAGESSIAVFALSSLPVTLRRVVVTAGKGVAGVDGTPTIADMTTSGPAGVTGKATTNPLCPASIGAGPFMAGQPSVNPAYPSTSTGASGTELPIGHGCTSGSPGSYGTAGGSGSGSAAAGAIDDAGWRSGDGLAGGRGGDGQGGGGGSTSYTDPADTPGTPGGGSPGGCCGEGGSAGHGGGASIAVLASHALVVLDSARLITSEGGRGGAGGKGQKAQLSSTFYPPSSDGSACYGAGGGIGGSGGGGGGGAGGLSVGILHDGTAPTINGTTTSDADTAPGIALGAAGSAGRRGSGGDPAQLTGIASRAGLPGSDGAYGQEKAVLGIP